MQSQGGSKEFTRVRKENIKICSESITWDTSPLDPFPGAVPRESGGVTEAISTKMQFSCRKPRITEA
jgi:hypothetical protein